MTNNLTKITDVQLADYVVKLKKLLIGKKLDALIDALKDVRYANMLINLRGKENEYIKLLWNVFKILLATFSTTELLKIFNERKIPESVFNQIMRVANRMRDEKMNAQIFDFINLHGKLLKDMGVIAEALHDQASWENAIAGDYQQALKLNKKALEISRKNRLKHLETKILFGLTHNKSLDTTINLKISNQIEDYQLYYKKFLELHDEYHALRALIESYSLRIEMYRHDAKKYHKEIDIVYQDLLALLQVQKKTKNYYLVMFIKRELSKALVSLGQQKKAEQYEKEYLKLKEGFSS